MRRLLITIMMMVSILPLLAQSWENVKNNRDYLYGEGWGNSIEEADKNALSDLITKIAVSVSSVSHIKDKSSLTNGQLNENSEFESSVKTYAQATLTNTERIIIHNEPDARVGRWIKR